MKPKVFVLDVDGVMTTGRFFVSVEGKYAKEFGPHDSDGLKMLRDDMDIQFITADKRGFAISEARITKEMGYPLAHVTEATRTSYFEKYNWDEVIFMGDGIHDAPALKKCLFGIAPANARKEAKEAADFVTESNSAEGAVLDAAIEIRKRFLD